MKLYIHKFLWLLLIVATLPLLSYGLNITLGAILGIPYEAFVGICIIIYVILITKIKTKNQEKQAQYFEEKEKGSSKIKAILNSKDLLSEIIVFSILMFPFIIKTIANQECDSIGEFVLSFLFSWVFMGIVYGLLSFVILFLVYSKWDKNQ